jgi:hypothetical protein
MGSRDEQDMTGEHRADVEEGERHLVVEDDVGGDLAGDDPAEDAVDGYLLGWGVTRR